MADENSPAGTTPPAGQAAPQASAPPPVAAPHAPAQSQATPPAPAQGQQRDPGWLNQRLAEKEKSVTATMLKELGFSSLEEAKAARADAIAKLEASKTIDTKLAEALSRESAAARRAEEAVALLSQESAQMLSALPDKLQEKIRASAGDDPVAQKREILRAVEYAEAIGVDIFKDEPATPAPPAPPASGTAPPRDAPPAGSSTPTDVRAQYAALESSNPFLASQFALQHAEQLYKS